jgi:hypothetical protein
MATSSTDRVRAFRARQRDALEPAADPGPRDADELLGPAVQNTVQALKLGPRDAAVAQLAIRYAAVIDDAKDPAAALRAFGPLLAKVLTELGATPAGRKLTGRQQPERSGPSRVAQLRAAHLATRAKQLRG